MINKNVTFQVDNESHIAKKIETYIHKFVTNIFWVDINKPNQLHIEKKGIYENDECIGQWSSNWRNVIFNDTMHFYEGFLNEQSNQKFSSWSQAYFNFDIST